MRRFLLALAVAGLLSGLWGTIAVSAAGGSGQQNAAPVQAQVQTPAKGKPSPLHNPDEYIGSDTCEACHGDIAKKFATNPHSQLALLHGGKGVTCESCHGPGKAHVESGGDVSKIVLRFTTASARQIDETCLGCHASAHPNFEHSDHAKASVSCTSCHSIHDFKVEEALLKQSQPTLCFQCHSDVKGSFSMPFHHPVKEGAVTCSDCHDVHGTFEKAQLRSTADQNKVCTKCHVETRGPFVFEHAPVKAEGCLSCHTPHGSQNARLLNMPAINALCNQCHSPVSGGTFHSTGAGSQALTPCTSCHTMIHGSNLNEAFLK